MKVTIPIQGVLSIFPEGADLANMPRKKKKKMKKQFAKVLEREFEKWAQNLKFLDVVSKIK
jgi:hypothetical protein